MTHPVHRTAAVLIIGDEILSGRTQDTNLNAIARFLAALGIDLLEARRSATEAADRRRRSTRCGRAHDYVFTTGGIGPTHDDITADCVAAAFGVAAAGASGRAGDPGRGAMATTFNEARRRMARIPEGGDADRQSGDRRAGLPDRQCLRHGRRAEDHDGHAGGCGAATAHRGGGACAHPAGHRRRRGRCRRHPDRRVAGGRATVSFGSYPFGHGSVGEVGTNLVIRGRDEAAVEAAASGLLADLTAAGIPATA